MRFLWIVSSIVLSGCVAYQPRPLDAAGLAARFEARSLSDPALRADIERASGRTLATWPVLSWDRQLLTLAAEIYSPALAVARAQQQATQAGIVTASASPNPTLAFPVEYALQHQGAGQPVTTGPALTWTVETGSKRAARIDQATAAAEAARHNVLDVAWKVRSQVRAAFLGVYAETRRSALLADKVGDLQRGVELLEHRLLAGVVAQPDVRRAQLKLAQAQSELAASSSAKADARTRLVNAMGMPVVALNGVAFDFTEFEHAVITPTPTPTSAGARKSAMPHRADLNLALAEYELGQAELRQEVARQYPDFQLGAGYAYDVGAHKISFGLGGVTLPVFDMNGGAIARAEAKRAELAARAEGLQGTIHNEIDHALARYRAAASGADRAARQVATAARLRDSVNASFARGASDRLELSLARVEFHGSALDYLNAMVALQEAAGLLDDAMQAPLPAAPIPMHLTVDQSAP